MLWVITCINKPNIDAIRDAARPAHREYLKKQDGIILLSGPLQNHDGSSNTGILFIVNVKSHAEAQAFADGEAYAKAGMFSSITITRMRKGHFNPDVADLNE
jgi:uncharacterized protein